jgi:hypothetical protein
MRSLLAALTNGVKARIRRRIVYCYLCPPSVWRAKILAVGCRADRNGFQLSLELSGLQVHRVCTAPATTPSGSRQRGRNLAAT